MAGTTGPSAGGNGQATAAAVTSPAAERDWVRRALDRYERALVSYAAHLAGDVERARGVVQETFVRLCGADRKQVEPRLAQWLFTVTRNGAIDARRKERRMRLVNELEAGRLRATDEAAADPAEIAERGDSVSLILRSLADLPPVQQEVIRLKFQHGLSYREIGEVLNLTATNVGFLIHTGIKTLRQRLAGDDANAPCGTQSKKNASTRSE
jgi:RNA polymerase sigma-70 factor (ECF subfamily)